MTLPVTVDPRYHDAVIFNLNTVLTDIDGVPVIDSTVKLVRKLLDAGVATAVYMLHPDGQQLLKAAGIDDLFGVCVEMASLPRSSSKPLADSACARDGLSSSTMPVPGWRRPTMAVSHSSSVSTAPGLPTNY